MARRSAGPIYQQIADDLRGRIQAGTLAPGAKLPTELGLAEEHGVTRATVRQAVQLLVNEGLVVADRPRGHFVRTIERLTYRPQKEWRERPAYPDLDQFMDEQVELGRKPEQTIAVELAEPPADVAARLNLPDGGTVVVRKRVRYLDGVPFNTNDSYFPRALVEGSEIMLPADIGRGANVVLAELGAEQTHAVDEIEVRMPTPDEASRLEIGLGVPVAMHRITGYTAEGRPVRVVRNVLPGDRHVVVFERSREQAAQRTDHRADS